MPFDEFLARFMRFFEPDVLAAYRLQPDRYVIREDYFEGRITSIPDNDKPDEQPIDVQYGYRTLLNGDLKIAAFWPDLEKSAAHVARWNPRAVPTGEWLEFEQDTRFSLWVRRYMEGQRLPENGQAFHLIEEIKFVNGLTAEATGRGLFSVDLETVSLPYPASQNSHAYENAHVALYGVLVDGLDKEGLTLVASAVGRPRNAEGKHTFESLQKIIPTVAAADVFARPLANVMEQRRRASHSHHKRAPAVAMHAFEQFTSDLQSCREAVKLLRTTLEGELHMDAKKATRRQDALSYMPRIAHPAQSNHLVSRALSMTGKTIESVECGTRPDIDGIHGSELIVIHFTDGSIMSIETAINRTVLDGAPHKPRDFRVELCPQWVPPKQ